MKLKNGLLLLALVLSAVDMSAWGRLGHDAIAYIAECNLSARAKKNISNYLDGKSIVYYSSWMDEVRETPEYKFSTRWHSAAVDENGEPCLGRDVKPEEYKGDAVLELMKLMDRMQNYKELDDSTVAVGIKMIVHLVGDMHCPGHVKYPGLKGFKVIYGGKKVSYHSVWDDGLIGSVHRWNYMEYNHQLGNLSRQEAKAIVAGDPVEWERGNARDCKVIYDWASPDVTLGKVFNNLGKPLADSQIQKAGYRLAKVLEDIFG